MKNEYLVIPKQVLEDLQKKIEKAQAKKPNRINKHYYIAQLDLIKHLQSKCEVMEDVDSSKFEIGYWEKDYEILVKDDNGITISNYLKQTKIKLFKKLKQ